MHPSYTPPGKCAMKPVARSYGSQSIGADLDLELTEDSASERHPIIEPHHGPHVRLLQHASTPVQNDGFTAPLQKDRLMFPSPHDGIATPLDDDDQSAFFPSKETSADHDFINEFGPNKNHVPTERHAPLLLYDGSATRNENQSKRLPSTDFRISAPRLSSQSKISSVTDFRTSQPRYPSESTVDRDAVDFTNTHLGEGAMKRVLQLLRKDLSDSHRRILRNMEPHLQGATYVDAEIAALRKENQRLNEQMKLKEVENSVLVEKVSLAKQNHDAALQHSMVSHMSSKKASKAAEARHVSIVEADCEKEASYDFQDQHSTAYVGQQGSVRFSSRVSAPLAEPKIVEDPVMSAISISAKEDDSDHEATGSRQLSVTHVHDSNDAQPRKPKLRLTSAGATATTAAMHALEEVAQKVELITKSPLERKVEELRKQSVAEHGGLAFEDLPTYEAENSQAPGVGERRNWRKTLQMVLNSNAFEMLFGAVIVSNSIFIGLEVDYTAAHPTEDIPSGYTITGYTYTTLFTIELMLRLVADWKGFLWSDGNQMMWNYLDILIVVSSLAEVALDVVKATEEGSEETEQGEEGGVNLSNLRIIRIIRITKLMRLFRIARIVKFVRALRTLIMSILSTLKSVFWSLLLLTVIIYCFAILFTQAATDYGVEIDLGSREPSLNPKETRDLYYFWGSLAESMLALFMSISGGVSWVEVSHPLTKVDPMWLYTFLIYISFVYFAVLNVVTGVFCQAAIESQQNDQEAMVQAFLSNKKLFTDRFMKLFKAIDSDDSGQVSKEEFEENLCQPKVEAYFATLGIDPSDARGLFRLLESNGEEGLDIEEFVHGCLRLKGPARSADLARLMHEHNVVVREVKEIHHLVSRYLRM